jgi:hypothetical protein
MALRKERAHEIFFARSASSKRWSSDMDHGRTIRRRGGMAALQAGRGGASEHGFTISRRTMSVSPSVLESAERPPKEK